MSQHKRIFIIGHSGAGKGVLAQALAEKLGWQFLDADFSLAPSIGRSMTDLATPDNNGLEEHVLSIVKAIGK